MNDQKTSHHTTRAGGRLTDRTIVVTGAGGHDDGIGVGRAIAITTLLENGRVVLVDREPEGAQRTIEIANELGAVDVMKRTLVVAADVTSAEDCQKASQEAQRRFGSVNGLVNNVGIIGPEGTAANVDPAAWSRAFDVNVTSGMLMTQALLPYLTASESGSAIVNMASTAGMRGGHPNLLYPTTKAAVINMTRAMAAHHGRAGVRVNAVAPGMVETPMVGSAKMTPERRRQRLESSLLGTPGTAWDVAKAVVFLLSEDARWITGVLLPVDAGLTAAASRPPVDPIL